jgi:hypothetical protein
MESHPGFLGGRAAEPRLVVSHQSSRLQCSHDNKDGTAPGTEQKAEQEPDVGATSSSVDSGAINGFDFAVAPVKFFDTVIVKLNVEKPFDFAIAPVARVPVEMADLDLSRFETNSGKDQY